MMWPLLIALIVLFYDLGRDHYFRTSVSDNSSVNHEGLEVERDPDAPLLLTPFILEGKLETARSLAKVQDVEILSTQESYSGFLTVNQTVDSNMFFWFFPAQNGPENSPVLLWLQGGPGQPSVFGLFLENGPFSVDDNVEVHLRNTTWTRFLSVLYIDNPVDVGFSFTSSEDSYPRNQEAIARDLYTALTQFFMLFPELQKNDFYLAGESYAGKYISGLGYKIHIENPTAVPRINLKGLIYVSGFCDPVSQSDYSDFLFHMGLIDDASRLEYKELQKLVIKYITEENWLKANEVMDQFIINDFIFKIGYSGDSLDNLLLEKGQPEVLSWPFRGGWRELLKRKVIRRAIHVGKSEFHEIDKAINYLFEDTQKSVKLWIEVLVDKYRTMFLSGQLDIIVAHPLTDSFLHALQWQGAEKFRRARRRKWYVRGQLAGYVKQTANLTHVLVRRAGHMISYDQPHWACSIVKSFIQGGPSNNASVTEVC